MKNLFTLFLALIASVGILFAESGTCGDNLTWDLTNGVLTISGTGDMTNWSSSSNVPWYSYRENITSVTIPNSVTSIGGAAFANCTNLTLMTSEAVNPPTCGEDEYVFHEVDKSIPLYVPANSVDAYKAADQWKDFTNIQAIPETPIASGAPRLDVPENGTLGIAIEIPAGTECNGIALKGTFNGTDWSGTDTYLGPESAQTPVNEGIYQFAPISGYDNWFYVEIPSSETLIFKICLISSSLGWQTQAEETILHPCNYTTVDVWINSPYEGECEFRNFDDKGGLLYLSVGDWQDSDCDTTLKARTVTVTLPECGFELPKIVGQFCNWNLDEAPVMQQVNGYTYKATVLLKDKQDFAITGSENGWDNRPAIYNYDEDNWYTSNYHPYADTIINLDYSGSKWPLCELDDATYLGDNYIVTFKSWGNVLKSTLVQKGNAAVAPTPSSRTNFKFVGWDKDFSNVTGHMIVQAIYEIIETTPEIEPTKGTCGDNLQWSFDDQTGTLTITGSGAMYDFGATDVPWKDYASSITSIVLPNGLTTFGMNAFRNCDKITAIKIPTALTASGNDAFYGCTGIREVHVDNFSAWCKVTFGNEYSNPLYYGQLYAPEETTPVTMLHIPSDVTDLSSALGGQTFTAVEIEDIAAYCSITMPSNFHPHEIYYNGKLVEHLVIPEGVTTIRNLAFEQATCLLSVTFPTTLQNIGDSAFAGCVNIEALTVNAIEPPAIDYMTFGGIKRDIPVSVPCESVDAYVAAPWWNEFTGYPSAIDLPADTVTIYNDESYNWRGLHLDTAGTYHDTVRYQVSGCDSIRYTLKLEVIERPVKTYTIIVVSSDAEAGTVTGGGAYRQGERVSLAATPNEDYVFVKWSNDSTSNPYQFTVTQDVKLIAYFQKKQAEEAEVTEPQAEPTDSSVVITWPVIDDAVVYTIEIKKDGELICTLSFNAMGQLIGITFAASSRQGSGRQIPTATLTANGWQYTITGLAPSTKYTYVVTAKKEDQSVLYNESVEFVTDSAQAIDQITNDQSSITNKIIKDNQLLILRGDKTYTLTGQETK